MVHPPSSRVQQGARNFGQRRILLGTLAESGITASSESKAESQTAVKPRARNWEGQVRKQPSLSEPQFPPEYMEDSLPPCTQQRVSTDRESVLLCPPSALLALQLSTGKITTVPF